MSAEVTVSDAEARRRALDRDGSFIVEAPAGSGKTGLLIERYLGLLARVEEPEEVVAITFTRKATGEMRERVLDALAGATAAPPEAPQERQTHELARAVHARDVARDWGIAGLPQRLRIMTIDALCGWLARQLPLDSGLPGDAVVADDARRLYDRAASLTLDLVQDQEEWARPLAIVLEHLDNQPGKLHGLLADMLGRRDQWLRLLGPRGADPLERRALLEQALARLVGQRLAELAALMPDASRCELGEVCRFAGLQLARAQPDGPPRAWAAAATGHVPGATLADLPLWQEARQVLQTAAGTWRRRFNKNDGFPAGDVEAAAMKRRAADLVAALAEVPGTEQALRAVVALPGAGYADEDWRVLDALVDVLRSAAAMLKVVFAERGEVDHAEVAAAARLALGDEEAPTDSALRLDYRIRHLLVDEFQDTAHTQFELLARLVDGWQLGDGRTLFLVGDPMQSIYRFREADVGLFQHAREHGVGPVRLAPLRLAANFRSRPGVVGWVNRVFPAVLPARDDSIEGAVAFRASQPVRADDDAPAVGVHLLADGSREAEADRVLALVQAGLARGPAATVAILVRARSHLEALLPRLRAAGIPVHGTDIEALGTVSAAQDLQALTSALLHPGERVALLATLRAPWCGLGLADLEVLAGDTAAPVPALLADPDRRARLSGPGRARLERVVPVLQSAATAAARGDVARVVAGAWQALGGPACCEEPGWRAAERVLALLRALGDEVLELGPAGLARRVSELFVADPVREPGTRGVEVMTIHKAKGLEFDTVIVPGLHRRPRAESRRAMAWSRRAAGPEAGDLLLAPLPGAASDGSPALYHLVDGLERTKAGHEVGRLLYVAATRARERLELLATVTTKAEEEGFAPPHAASLLALLWPILERDGPVPEGAVAALDAGAGSEPGGAVHTRHLPAGWCPPEPAAPVGAAPAPMSASAELPGVEFDWAGRGARHVGTVVHRMLRLLAVEGPDAWPRERLLAQRPVWRSQLRALGLPGPALAPAEARILAALEGVGADSRGRWLLDPGHRAAASELALAGLEDDRVVHVVIDCTFIDAEGVRWVVDYKSGSHEGGDLAAFLDREQERYEPQLERYARLLAARGDEPVRLALYFPMVGGWREWSPVGAVP